MRILFDPDGACAHVWLPAGHGTVEAERVRWHTPHEPFTTFASATRDAEVRLPPRAAHVLDRFTDVFDAITIDDVRVAVVHGASNPSLTIVDTQSGRAELHLELQVQGRPVDAFEAASGSEDAPGDRDDTLGSNEPRGLRLLAAGRHVAIASAASGHVASVALDRGAVELAFRVPTREGDDLWAIPFEGGLIVAAVFRPHWVEVCTLDVNGQVLGRWPTEEHDVGLVTPVVLGRHVVMFTASKAHVLALPSLDVVDTIDLEGGGGHEVLDAHGARDRVGCVTRAHVYLGRLDADGHLAFDKALSPLELIERAGARRSTTAAPAGVERRAFDLRLDDVFPDEPMLLVTVDGAIVRDDGREALPEVAPDPFFGGMFRRRLLDARAGFAVATSTEGTTLHDLASGASHTLTRHAAMQARRLTHGTWLLTEQRVEDADADPFAPVERVVTYVPDQGDPLELRRAPALSGDVFVAHAEREVVWSEPGDDEVSTHVFRFDEGGAYTNVVAPARLRNLALDGAALYAAEGDVAGRIVRVGESGDLTPVSDEVFEWLDVLQSFVVARGWAYWVTPYATSAPSALRALRLGAGAAPDTVVQASFGALASLRVARDRLSWLESQTRHAEANGVNVLEPIAILGSIALREA